MSSNEPMKNGCEVIYEMFHIRVHTLYTSEEHISIDEELLLWKGEPLLK